MSQHWIKVKLAAGKITEAEEGQLMLHEVLHVLYSSAVDEHNGLVNRDLVAQALMEKFSPHRH
jgi:hypothetical protein|tara:strand:- start:96 stop:284 length:189 start_codon:yes stop_codon:yes gene_type:complete